MICHVTQTPLLFEFANPLTLSARAREGARGAFVKQGPHPIPRVARPLLKRKHRSRRQYGQFNSAVANETRPIEPDE